ncbi:unnamed protein product [Gongylonema pulchrum]|uniref:SAC domain-containing protein n=1 Tax=Gongylonema pulchrum TaxID=637853 RepID=A0A183DLT3_9BILA|nr:unnamed protein product [Gongylonema pulchrum]
MKLSGIITLGELDYPASIIWTPNRPKLHKLPPVQALGKINDYLERNLVCDKMSGESPVCIVLVTRTLNGTVTVRADCKYPQSFWPLTYPEAKKVTAPYRASRECEEAAIVESDARLQAYNEFCKRIDDYQDYYNGSYAGAKTAYDCLILMQERQKKLSAIAYWYTKLHPEWDYAQVHVAMGNLMFVQYYTSY